MMIARWKKKWTLDLRRRENLQNDYYYSIFMLFFFHIRVIRKYDIDIGLIDQAKSSSVTFRGLMFQISRAYSWMVRSLLNFPVLRAFKMDFLVHSALF